MIDRDGDGTLGVREFNRFFIDFAFRSNEPIDVYDIAAICVDRDGDGVVSQRELARAF